MAAFNTPVRKLIHACSRTDSGDAWEELVRRYGDVIRRAVYRATKEAELARCHDLQQELVQEVYCRLLEHRRRYLRGFRGTSECEARGFFVDIARSVVYNYGRRMRARKRRPELDGRYAGELVPSPSLLETLSPEVSFLQAETWREFWRQALETLKDRPTARRDLSIFHLYAVEGFTTREIARGLPGALKPSSVQSVVHRVRSRLNLEGPRRVAA